MHDPHIPSVLSITVSGEHGSRPRVASPSPTADLGTMDPVRRLNARLEGTGARTLVLANGFCTTRDSWDAVRAVVPPGWRTLTFDYVGNPGTPLDAWCPERHASLHGHADDVVALLAALDVRDALWIGHSMGAIVGALAHLADPACIARLVLLCASPRYVDDPATGYCGGFTQAEVDETLAQADADLAAWMAGFAPVVLGSEAAPHLVQAYAQHVTRLRPDVARVTLRSIFGADWRHVLPRVHCPALVLQPARDAAVPPAVGRYLADALPQATLRTLDVTGHLPHLTHPAAVVAAVADVFADAPPAPGTR